MVPEPYLDPSLHLGEPGIFPCSVFSYFHAGQTGYITRSIYLTFINPFVTFLAMCFSEYLVILVLDDEDQPFVKINEICIMYSYLFNLTIK